MLNKKGVPDTIKHSLRGCVLVNGSAFVPLEEMVKFCRRFFTLTGATLALTLTQTVSKLKKEEIPEVFIVSKKSLLGKILSLFLK